jgi:hypothetical protein
MEMKITYEVKGAPRRELAQAISEVLNTIENHLRAIVKCIDFSRKAGQFS